MPYQFRLAVSGGIQAFSGLLSYNHGETYLAVNDMATLEADTKCVRLFLGYLT